MPDYTGTISGSGVFSSGSYSADVTFSGSIEAILSIDGSATSGTYSAPISYTSSWIIAPPGDPPAPSGSLGSGGTESGTAPNVLVTATSGPLVFTGATLSKSGGLSGGGTTSLPGYTGSASFSFTAQAALPVATITAPPSSIIEGDSANAQLALSGNLSTGDVYTFRVTSADGTAKSGTDYNSIDTTLTLDSANNWTASIPIQTLQNPADPSSVAFALTATESSADFLSLSQASATISETGNASSGGTVLYGNTPALLRQSNPTVPAGTEMLQSPTDPYLYTSPAIADNYAAIGSVPESGGENSVFGITADAAIDAVKGMTIQAAIINNVPYADYVAGANDTIAVGQAINGTLKGVMNLIQQGVAVTGQASYVQWQENCDTFFTSQKAQYASMAASQLTSVVPGVGWVFAPVVAALTRTTYLLEGKPQPSSGSSSSVQPNARTNLVPSVGTFQVAVTLDSTINAGSTGGIVIAGDQFNDITLGAGSFLVRGGAGGNTFMVDGSGADTITGGGGTNTMDYSGLTTPGLVAIIQGGAGVVNKGGANGNDTLRGVQDLVDTGTGRSNGDVFYVDSAENVTANSGNFSYLIELSAGVNLAYGANFTGISEFVSNVGTNTLDFSNDSHFAYVYGSTGNDTLTLGSGGGYLFGEGGANTLTGGANATNLLVGGQGGTDTMNGGGGTASNYYFVDGADQVNGAGAFNTVIELVTGVTVQLGSAQYQHVQEFVGNSGNNVVTVVRSDSDFVYLYGGAGNDTLSTGSGGGYLFGEGGTNVLTGHGGTNVFVADNGSGVDTMNGGTGSNIYYIDNNSTVHGAGTFNTVIELQQNVSLTLGSAQLGTDVQQVVLNGGTNSADFHTATGSVFLYGGAGNDTLFGGTGNDFLYGGAGTNIFTFATGWGHDTIEDWTAGTNNQIDLTALAGQGVHAVTDLTQTITGGNDIITSSLTGTNSITLNGFAGTLGNGSYRFG